MPSLDQRKKRGFCKYHKFLGYYTYQCVLFRDLVQNSLKDGRLKFGDKPKAIVQVESDLVLAKDENFVEHV